MTNQMFNNSTEAGGYIESLFPPRGGHSHFFSQHISNRGKEAYEFNIKCCIRIAGWVSNDEYSYRMEDELTDHIIELKDKYSWIKECFQAGRNGGWLVITTYDRILENWEDSDFSASEEDVIKRANELYDIEKGIKNAIDALETLNKEDTEEYWEYCKPKDWDEQVEQNKLAQERAKEERNEREKEVIDYIPSDDFYLIETSHRKWIINDRGDIISSYDKMKRNDSWGSYGQVPGKNTMVGWNRITSFVEEGIAPRRILLNDAINGKNVQGYSFIVYNAPSGRRESYGQNVEYINKISKDRLSSFGIESVA